MMKNREDEDFVPGITDFDAYSNWQFRETFKVHTVCPDGITVNYSGEELHLTVEEKTIIAENIQKNVVSLPKEYPDVDFYLSFDYESLNEQKDYENDFYVAALFGKEFSGVDPLDLLSNEEDINLATASLSIDSDNGAKSVVCVGWLNREPQNSVTIYDYLLNDEYIGV